MFYGDYNSVNVLQVVVDFAETTKVYFGCKIAMDDLENTATAELSNGMIAECSTLKIKLDQTTPGNPELQIACDDQWNYTFSSHQYSKCTNLKSFSFKTDTIYANYTELGKQCMGFNFKL